MNNSIQTLISSAKSILIVLPADPNFDTVAASTSIYLALSQVEGKEISLYCPTKMIVEFNRLVGVNKIKNEIGNKNLSITFEGYNPQGIERVAWDIDDGKFKLTIVPKANVTPPKEDQVRTSYIGIMADAAILVGGLGDSFPVVLNEDMANISLIHVGNKDLSISGKTISSLARNGSSNSEAIANTIKDSGLKIDNDIATNLLMGIEEATKGFSLTDVTADTFSLVSDLMKAGGKRISTPAPSSLGDVPSSSSVPSSWTEPKIFKGTSLS